jgi:hypothetical protein
MDLAAVFDLRSMRLHVISYEQDPSVARQSRECPVARTLSKVESIKIIIVPTEFPSRLERIAEVRKLGPIIYFLDGTGTFGSREGEAVSDLLDACLLLPGDYLLITSCMSPRIVHQQGFMGDHLSFFKLLWPTQPISSEFKARNHVEVYLTEAFDRHERAIRGVSTKIARGVTSLRKLRYKDSKSPMGLWAYRIDGAPRQRFEDDQLFDDFPTSFVVREEHDDDGPDLFRDLLR